MGISVGVSTGEGIGEGSDVFVATGGVYSAVCVPKNEATMVPTPEVKTKSTSVVGVTSELPPQAVRRTTNKNRHKFRLAEIMRSSKFRLLSDRPAVVQPSRFVKRDILETEQQVEMEIRSMVVNMQ